MVKLKTPLEDIYGIGPKFLARLNKLGIKTVSDLIRHFPFRYEDFSIISPIAEVAPGQTVTVSGKVVQINARRSWQRRLMIVEGLISDETGRIKAVWFNQPYIKNALARRGPFNFSGKVGTYGGEMVLANPMYEAVGKQTTKHTGRLVPIYPETRGITSKGLRAIIKPVLENLEEVTEWLPLVILDRYQLPEINEAIRMIHWPAEMSEVEAARRRFAFEELFLLSILGLKRKVELAREKARGIAAPIAEIKAMISNLPFKMTVSQRRCLWEILKDMERLTPMNRLLQGDVGSGKTVVAALAAMATARAGLQTALMAPTEVLAQQHYRTITNLFGNTGVGIALLTAGSRGRMHLGEGLEEEFSKREIKKQIEAGEVGVVIGTQALIQKDVAFKKLGLAVVDEQHRFGVGQRAAIISAGEKVRPHFLSMSATPIPRTLMLSIFGDLNLSVIDELPPGRQKLETRIIPPNERAQAYQFIRDQVKAGRQVFVICPRIEAAENELPTGQNELFKLEVKSVNEEYEKLKQKVFPDLRVEKLHGRMKAREKIRIMTDFKNRRIDILISTSVIEVGVDVPNATIMMIEGAERFGLAQLYQFRGRVGRGEHQSYCFLFTEVETEKTRERLAALVTAKNGFELAEKDLAIRGPGQFLGKKQTGLPDTAMRSLANLSIIREAREAAVTIIKQDPTFKNESELKRRLEEFKEEIHRE